MKDRTPPTCIICGGINAKAEYKQSLTGTPVYGDSFLGWEPIDCKCKKDKTMTKTAESVLESARKNNEPVFVLRAKDVCSIRALTEYLMKCEVEGSPDEYTEGVKAIRDDFQRWQNNHSEDCKVPD